MLSWTAIALPREQPQPAPHSPPRPRPSPARTWTWPGTEQLKTWESLLQKTQGPLGGIPGGPPSLLTEELEAETPTHSRKVRAPASSAIRHPVENASSVSLAWPLS